MSRHQLVWNTREGSVVDSKEKKPHLFALGSGDQPPPLILGYIHLAGNPAWAALWINYIALTAIRAAARTAGVQLTGGWKIARMAARCSAGATAERGAVAKYL